MPSLKCRVTQGFGIDRCFPRAERGFIERFRRTSGVPSTVGDEAAIELATCSQLSLE
jgi:hypothetical protein